MIVDPDEFRELVLPAAIEKSLPKFFSENPLTHFMVQVEDGGGDLLYTSRRPDGGEEDLEVLMAATRPFGFIFKDWGVAVQRHGGSAEEWARTNFLLNLTLSGLLGVLLIGGSVFTLRTAAREVRLSEMKSDFVSNVSHELRTPLASIQAFGELLRRGKVKDGGRAREYGDYIETESRRLGDLIGNILDFSSIESGERSYRFEKVDFAAAVVDVLATFEIRAREAGFQVVLEERPTQPLWVRADSPGGRPGVDQPLGQCLQVLRYQQRDPAQTRRGRWLRSTVGSGLRGRDLETGAREDIRPLSPGGQWPGAGGSRKRIRPVHRPSHCRGTRRRYRGRERAWLGKHLCRAIPLRSRRG